jgi:hypothetical protein
MQLNTEQNTPLDGVLHALSGKEKNPEKSSESEQETVSQRLKKANVKDEKENETSEARTPSNESSSDSDQDANGDDHREDEKIDFEGESDENSQENAGENSEAQQSESQESEEGEQEGEEVDEIVEAVKLADIAKELELEASDLYEIEIPLGGEGESMTLGEMKDQIQEFAPKMEKLKNIELEQIHVRSERVKHHQELESLVQHLPDGALTPEYVAAVKEQATAEAKVQTEKLLTLMPEWGDSLTYQKDFGGMVSTLKKYGLSATDLNNIQDHRFIKILHDFTTVISRKSEAKRLAKTLPKSPSKRGKTNVKAVKAKAKGKLADKLRQRAKGGDKQAQREIVGGLLT